MTDHISLPEPASPGTPEPAATFRARASGRAIVLEVTGELDLAAEDEFERALRDAIAQRDCLIIDLSLVPFMDCAALGVLIAVRAELEAAGGRLCLVTSGDGITRLLEAGGVSFPLADSVLQAQTVVEE